MWYPAAVVAPLVEPVTLNQAKAHLRVDHSDEDALISALIKAARSLIENACGVRFAQRTGVAIKCDSFDDFARLPEAPVSAISSVSYVDVSGATQTLASTVYELRADGVEAAIVLKSNQSWPGIKYGSRITVTASLGYSEAPEDICHALLMLVAYFYENREDAGSAASDLPFAVNALICNHRRGV